MWAGVGASAMAILTLIRYWIPAWPCIQLDWPCRGTTREQNRILGIYRVAIKVVVMKMGGVSYTKKESRFSSACWQRKHSARVWYLS